MHQLQQSDEGKCCAVKKSHPHVHTHNIIYSGGFGQVSKVSMTAPCTTDGYVT